MNGYVRASYSAAHAAKGLSEGAALRLASKAERRPMREEEGSAAVTLKEIPGTTLDRVNWLVWLHRGWAAAWLRHRRAIRHALTAKTAVKP